MTTNNRNASYSSRSNAKANAANISQKWDAAPSKRPNPAQNPQNPSRINTPGERTGGTTTNPNKPQQGSFGGTGNGGNAGRTDRR